MQAPGKQQTSTDDVLGQQMGPSTLKTYPPHLKAMEETKLKPQNRVHQEPEDRLQPDPLHVNVHPSLLFLHRSQVGHPTNCTMNALSLFSPLLLAKEPASL